MRAAGIDDVAIFVRGHDAGEKRRGDFRGRAGELAGACSPAGTAGAVIRHAVGRGRGQADAGAAERVIPARGLGNGAGDVTLGDWIFRGIGSEMGLALNFFVLKNRRLARPQVALNRVFRAVVEAEAG